MMPPVLDELAAARLDDWLALNWSRQQIQRKLAIEAGTHAHIVSATVGGTTKLLTPLSYFCTVHLPRSLIVLA